MSELMAQPSPEMMAELMLTDLREDNSPFIVHPFSRFKSWWDALVLLAVCYNAIVIPLDIAFVLPDQPFTTLDGFFDALHARIFPEHPCRNQTNFE